MFDHAKAWIVEHPGRRAWVTSGLTILTSLCIAALVRDLAEENSIAWSKVSHSHYTYILIIIYVVFASLQSTALKFDKNVAKSISRNNPFKYVQDQCLDDYATHCKKLLAEGNLEEYLKAQNQLPGKGKTP